MVKKLSSPYKICCSSQQTLKTQRDYIHFYFVVRAKLNKGDAPDSSQMNERIREV